MQQICATPTFSTTEEGESYLTASSWSGYGYLTKEKDYRLDLTFKRTSGNLGVYFNCANDYVGDKTDGYNSNELLAELQPTYSVATVVFDNSIIYKSSNSQTTSAASMRIVFNDRVVFPADGGWQDLTDTYSGNKYYFDCSVKVKAGDRLYFIVDSSATIYAPMACRIDQLYFTVAKVNHVDSTNNTVVATENFFNGLLFSGTGSIYTREDLMSYASVVVTDVVENNDTLTYALVNDSQPQIISVRNVDYVVYNEEKNKNVGELVA